MPRAGRLGSRGGAQPAGRGQLGPRPQPQPGREAFSGLQQKICSFTCWTSEAEEWVEKPNFLIWGLHPCNHGQRSLSSEGPGQRWGHGLGATPPPADLGKKHPGFVGHIYNRTVNREMPVSQ